MYKEILAYTSGHSVTLVAVSKTKPAEDIMKLYQSGQRIFGENKVQEMVSKYEVLPNDIQWHQIGHLQKNKVKYIAPFVAMIHAVDSFELLEVINKEAVKNSRTIDVLLQFHIATEETKFGLNKDEAVQLLTVLEKEPLPNVRICGVMGMASFTEDTNLIRSEFRSLNEIFTSLKNQFFVENPFFKEISMGMSGDYKIAIEEGSTMVRIGSAIFG
ncbi:MAG: YggS family pyridoxal phosphate-dependent enzyme, partial [Saprospiraceae bacterium]